MRVRVAERHPLTNRCALAGASRIVPPLGLLALAVFAPAAQADRMPAQNPAWDRIVATANAESKVIIAGPPGTQWRDATMKFETAHPGITVEFMGAVGRDHVTRLLAERRGGLFQWDLLIAGAASGVSAKSASVLDPLNGALVLPEVLNDRGWLGGFADGWMDNEGRFIYAFMGDLSPEVYVNRDVIPEKELSRVEALVDPKWRGRISWNEPRAPGGGSLQAANLLYLLGDDFLQKLLKQDVAVIGDLRQQVDWIVRGKYPIAMSLDYRFLTEFQRQGVGLNVVPLAPDTAAGGGKRLSPGFGCVMLINQAPHPNAAKVFVNWLLSRQGQDAYAQATGVNSRRVDAVSGREIARPKPGVKYYSLNKENMLQYNDRAIVIAKDILK